jgi:hypothetical protein
MFDDETNEWNLDVDGEESAFPNGTIYNDEINTWEYGYAGDGNFVGMEDTLSTQLSQQLDKWNLLLKTGDK